MTGDGQQGWVPPWRSNWKGATCFIPVEQVAPAFFSRPADEQATLLAAAALARLERDAGSYFTPPVP